MEKFAESSLNRRAKEATALMHRGYIKSWRRTKESPVSKNPVLFQFWMWCLWKAAYKQEFVSVKTGKGETIVELQRGQLLFGRNVAARELGAKPSTIHDKLKKLERLKKVVTQPAPIIR